MTTKYKAEEIDKFYRKYVTHIGGRDMAYTTDEYNPDNYGNRKRSGETSIVIGALIWITGFCYTFFYDPQPNGWNVIPCIVGVILIASGIITYKGADVEESCVGGCCSC